MPLTRRATLHDAATASAGWCQQACASQESLAAWPDSFIKTSSLFFMARERDSPVRPYEGRSRRPGSRAMVGLYLKYVSERHSLPRAPLDRLRPQERQQHLHDEERIAAPTAVAATIFPNTEPEPVNTTTPKTVCPR